MIGPRLLLLLVACVAACSDPAADATTTDAPTRTSIAAIESAPERVELDDVQAVQAAAETRVEPAPAPVPVGTDVVVTVVDSEGAPAPGVLVTGCEVDADGAVAGRVKWGFAVETDATGTALVPAKRTGSRFVAELFGRAYALSEPDEPTRIVLPPTGALEVDLEALGAGAKVRITPHGRKRRAARFDAEAGAVLAVPGVTLGERLTVLVTSTSGRASVEVDGPTRAGEVVRVVPEFEPMIELRARLVDASGAPLRGAQVLASQGGVFGNPPISLGPADEDGRVSKHVRREAFFESIGGPVRLREVARFPVSRAPLRAGSAVLAPAAPARVYDLGDVVLELPPLLVSGRIVDAVGGGVEGAEVEVEVPYLGLDMDDPDMALLAELIRLPALSTDGDGAYSFRSPLPLDEIPDAKLTLSVKRDGVASTLHVPFEVGQEELVITVVEPGTLRIDGANVPGALWSQLSFDVSPADEGERDAGGPRIRVQAGDEVEARPSGDPETQLWERRLDPGTYDVAVELGDSTLHRVTDVRVPAGAASNDPRLAPLSLEGLVSVRTVYVQRPDGTPIAGARAVYAESSLQFAADFLGLPGTLPGAPPGSSPGSSTGSSTGPADLPEDDLVRQALERAGARRGERPVRWYWGDAVGEPSGSDGALAVVLGRTNLRSAAVTAKGYLPRVLGDVDDGEAVVLEPLVDVTVVFALAESAEGAVDGTVTLRRGQELELSPVDSSIPWVDGPTIRFRKAPHEATVALPSGMEFEVDGWGSPWEDQTFVVPPAGGRVVVLSADDDE